MYKIPKDYFEILDSMWKYFYNKHILKRYVSILKCCFNIPS